ncbi:hypothetical protein [Mesobacillus harenae]|uniref:hypothetical protein n=1 Tax=Mesobacillus harenae TaxID=2213203 RepID=UPI001580DCB3|nr:hypothetical protein [Mesobacillus harenae]
MAEYVVNKAGAKVYTDISKHEVLAIPTLKSTAEQGALYKVLSVGMHRKQTPIATVKKGNGAKAYILPEELHGWALNVLMTSADGVKMFPATVEFGVLNGRSYAEIL